MRVLVFTSLYPNNIWPNHGVFIKERMTWFARVSQCPVKVVAPVPYFPPLKLNARWRYSQVTRQEIIEGLDVYHPRYYMVPKIGMMVHGVMMALSLLPVMRAIRKSFDFDIIDAHFVYPDGFAATVLGRLFHRPVVVSARGSDINLYKQFPVIRRFLRQTLRHAERVIAVSQALKDGVVGLGIAADKIAVIPNGVDACKFFPVPKLEARTKLGLPYKRMLLSVGNLTSAKGFDLLIRVFRLLVDEGLANNLHLSVIGEGEARKELENLVSSLNLNEYVHLFGAVPHNELSLWYSAADVFCLASSREGWPNVLLESLACGTPVVAVQVGGVPEIVNADYLGTVTERNERSLMAAIVSALKKQWNPTLIARHAQKQTWDNVSLAVLQVFESVMNCDNVKSDLAGRKRTFCLSK